MQQKEKLLQEIKELFAKQKLQEFTIEPELLEYLSLKDLQELKIKILQSLSTLSSEDKKWLAKFKKEK